MKLQPKGIGLVDDVYLLRDVTAGGRGIIMVRMAHDAVTSIGTAEDQYGTFYYGRILHLPGLHCVANG